MSNAEPHPAPIPSFLNPGARNAAAARDALHHDGRFALVEVAPDELIGRVTAAVREGAPTVLVAGGDGTLRQAVEVLRGTSTALAVLPGGTRNHFARDFGIPLDAAAALDVAATGRVRAVDLGSVNGHAILNTSSVGAYVTYVRLRRRLDRWIGYVPASVIAGLVSLRRHRTFSVQIEIEGKLVRYEASLVFVGVGERTLERPAPGSRRLGGASALHLFVVHEPSRIRLAGLVARTFARGIPFIGEEEGVHAFLLDSCEIQLTRPEGTAALDGELVAMRAPLAYRIEKKTLRVILPP